MGHRMKTYLRCIRTNIDICKPLGVHIVIVENSGLQESYLDQFKHDATVIYTNNNKDNYRLKGFNELLDIKHVINTMNIKDEDMIIKITGRYHLLNDLFVQKVLRNDKDAYIKFFNVCKLQFMHDDCVLGLIAIRCKYYKQFEYTIESNDSNEVEIAKYVRNVIGNFEEIIDLGLHCCFADNLRTLIV